MLRLLILMAAIVLPVVVIGQVSDPTLPDVVMSWGASVLMALAFGLHWVIDEMFRKLPQWAWLMLAPGIMTGLVWAGNALAGVSVPMEWAPLLGLAVDWVHDQTVWFRNREMPT